MEQRLIQLIKRPQGLPRIEDFRLAKRQIPSPVRGQVLIENKFLSVDPYMRGLMSGFRTYTAPYDLNAPLSGGAVGRVLESRAPSFLPGDWVLHYNGWRDITMAEAKELERLPNSGPDPREYLTRAGMTAQTAYWGLKDLGQPIPGDWVFVSAAAGAVGSMTCQMAKLWGCTVVGSAGSRAKCDWLRQELGVDKTILYKEKPDLLGALKKEVPEGIDIYFDNVGGGHLQAALHHMNRRGRIVVCGMISQYNGTQQEILPNDLTPIITKELDMRGFLVSRYSHRSREFLDEVMSWIKNNQLIYRETVYRGLEEMPRAFIGLFKGENMGKTLVEIE